MCSGNGMFSKGMLASLSVGRWRVRNVGYIKFLCYCHHLICLCLWVSLEQAFWSGVFQDRVWHVGFLLDFVGRSLTYCLVGWKIGELWHFMVVVVLISLGDMMDSACLDGWYVTGKPVIWLYTSNKGTHWYDILYGNVKSLSLKDLCLCLGQCLVCIYMCTN